MQNRTESFQKPVSIGIVFKNVSPLDTSAYDMMQGTRRIYSGLTRHVTSLPQTNEKRNAQYQPRPALWTSRFVDDGSARLGVYADIMTRWSSKPGIVNFLENFVAPFLVWQAYYDAHQKPPSWGERSHFAKGIIEYYAELLGMNNCRSVVEFMRLLARKNHPKGHEICPCGSGDRLRNCHRALLYNTREKVSWKYVAKDLQAVLRDNRSKY